jgi:hypothetical protein
MCRFTETSYGLAGRVVSTVAGQNSTYANPVTTTSYDLARADDELVRLHRQHPGRLRHGASHSMTRKSVRANGRSGDMTVRPIQRNFRTMRTITSALHTLTADWCGLPASPIYMQGGGGDKLLKQLLPASC